MVKTLLKLSADALLPRTGFLKIGPDQGVNIDRDLDCARRLPPRVAHRLTGNRLSDPWRFEPPFRDQAVTRESLLESVST